MAGKGDQAGLTGVFAALFNVLGPRGGLKTF